MLINLTKSIKTTMLKHNRFLLLLLMLFYKDFLILLE